MSHPPPPPATMETFTFSSKVDRLRALNVKRPRARKPRIERPTFLQTLFRRRNVKQSVHYFTSGRTVDPALCPTFGASPPERSPYWFPAEHEEFSYKILRQAWQERERAAAANARYDTRQSYRTLQTRNLAERLHVADDADDVARVPGMLDIDPEYFSIVAGRPNADKTTMLDYRATVKETLKTRLRAYYLLDDALKIDENFVAEQRAVDQLSAELKTYTDSYEEYLAKDHKQSMDMLRLSELNFKISQERQKVHKKLDRDVGRCKSRIIILEERWRTLKVYQRFLYEVSPLDWRAEFDYVHRKPGGGSLDLAPGSLYAGRPELGSAESLDQLVANYHADVAEEQPPVLYFTDPQQLLDIFAYIEVQNLNSLLHVEDVLVPLEELRAWISEAQRKLHKEFGHIELMIADVEAAIADEELRAHTLEMICRDYLYGLFRALVSADDALDLHVYIEDVYERCIAHNDTNLSMFDMMKRLEVETEAIMLQIDHLPVTVVRKVEARVFAEKDRVMHEAKESDKKLHIMHIMLRGLARAMAPPYKRVGKPLMPRTEPPAARKVRKKPATPITGDKMEVLQFFTDYCRHTDVGDALQDMPDISGLNFD